jgi:O-Antigen ligase
MDTVLIALYTALPFIAVAILAVLAVAGMGVGAVWPRFLVYPYLAVYFWVNSTSYGNNAMYVVISWYTRGSGVLLFPLLLYYVLGAWCCARVSASFQGYHAPPCNLRPWFLGWAALLAGHVAVALFSNVKLADALAPSGFSNIIWMAPLISLLLLSFRTREHAVELSRFIMLAGLVRATFGLVRWAAFGGDPNNVYANANEIHIKLTFFDINDSLMCTLALAIAAVSLFQTNRVRQHAFWAVVEWATLGATALCVVLSYRRTAWIGVVLASVVIMMRFPLKRRIQLVTLGLPPLAVGLLYVMARRFSQTKGAGRGLIEGMFSDMESARFGAESERVLELKLALSDFLSHLLTGIGSWGRYAGYQRISWQSGPDGGLFLHSGLLHIALKSGLVGLVLFTGTICAFVIFARRALRTLPPEQLALATAGVAGLAFMIPDLLVGTPFPQVRTTQMLAICLALPYVAMAACQDAQPERVTSRLNLVPA